MGLKSVSCVQSGEGPGSYRNIMQQVLVKYPVPVKPRCGDSASGVSSPFVIKWFHEDRLHSTEATTSAIPEAVRNCFESHGKKLSDAALGKLKNTVEFLPFVDTLCLNANTARTDAKLT
jgi:hypothetical protein